MNRDDQFEKRLQRQPPRQVPVEWRADILSSAQAAAASRPSTLGTRHSWLSTLNAQLSTLLWPCPQAWAGLAAAWLVILGASFAARDAAPMNLTRQMTPPTPQVRELLKQQGQLLAELVGPLEKPEADRPKPLSPQPRSQYRVEFLNA